MADLYIAGPMAGHYDLNRAAFARVADHLRDGGHSVVNPHDLAPHEHDGPCPPSYAIKSGWPFSGLLPPRRDSRDARLSGESSSWSGEAPHADT
jgi:hypothetical protein